MVFLIVAIISLLLILLCVIIYILPGIIMTGKRQTLEDALAWQSDHYDTSFYDALEKNDYEVKGYNGYCLHVQLLKCPSPSGKYVIITHGYTDNRMGALKYAKMYLDMGFNCVIYDLRGHGKNDPAFTTYGILEAEDLKCLIEDTRSRYPELKTLGLHGESLGAATTVTCLKFKPSVDFAVADCGFSDIMNVLSGAYKSAHIPGLVLPLADIGAKIRYGYRLKDMRPIDSLDNNKIPVLFIHGSDDTLIPPKNSKDMKKRTKGRTGLVIIKGAGHAMSAIHDPEAYTKACRDFISALPGPGS